VSTTPRVITAKFAGRCWDCRQPFPEGERISYLPAEGGRKSRSSHLACVENGPQPPQPAPPPERFTPGESRAIYTCNNRRCPEVGREWEAPAPAANVRFTGRRATCRRCGDIATWVRPAAAEPEPMQTTAARREESPPAVQQRPADPTRSLVGDGFPVSRQQRAGHVRPPVVQRQTSEPRPTLPPAYSDNPDCVVCQRGGPGPSHNGSPRCRSGSPASGGRHAHCSCDTCY